MIRLALALAVALASAAPALAQDRFADAAAASRFSGQALVARKGDIVWSTPAAYCPPLKPGGGTACVTESHAAAWPWASVTKQVMAILTMQQVAAGRIDLDAPAGRYLPALAGAEAPTVRQLLQHRAGLRNPEDSPKDAAGRPGWYTNGPTGLDWCLAGRGKPGGAWRYNNCDTIVLGALLQRATGQSVPALFADRIARPARLVDTGFIGSGRIKAPLAMAMTAAERATLARYGAAGGLVGPPADLLRLDRALMTGALMSDAARDEMWRGDPALGYMALGQWSFDAPLKGCAVPVRLIERRGAIGRFQVRNVIAPDRDAVVILFTADGDFDFGEIWQGAGFSHDMLAAALCP